MSGARERINRNKPYRKCGEAASNTRTGESSKANNKRESYAIFLDFDNHGKSKCTKKFILPYTHNNKKQCTLEHIQDAKNYQVFHHSKQHSPLAPHHRAA